MDWDNRPGEREHLRAPFTAEQVHIMNRWQTDTHIHPFTCPWRSHHPNEPDVLVAAERGWFCPTCTYEQFWAHASQGDPVALQHFLYAQRDMFSRFAFLPGVADEVHLPEPEGASSGGLMDHLDVEAGERAVIKLAGQLAVRDRRWVLVWLLHRYLHRLEQVGS